MGLYYLQTNIMSILFLLIIYLTLRNRNYAMPASRVAFNRLLVIIAVICVSDICAWYFLGQDIEGAREILQVSNIIYDGAITWAGYAWLSYVELRIKSIDYNFKKRQLISAIPLAVMIILLVTNPFTNLMFTIDENNIYSRGNGIFLHWIISWFYLVYATIEVIIRIRKSTSRVERDQFIPMLWFIVPPAVAAILQMLLYGLTSTQCGMTLAAMIIAINFLVDEVSTDSMTGLNNRRAFETALTEQLQKSNAKLTIFMCDIDKFKIINDTLGHTAGDLILKRMAEAMKNVCASEERNLVLCRYGGDEFVICGTDMETYDANGLMIKIEDSIKMLNQDYGNTLSFGISIGDATGICKSYEDVEALIATADAKMYAAKENKE